MLRFRSAPPPLSTLLAVAALAVAATGCPEEVDLCADGQVRNAAGECVDPPGGQDGGSTDGGGPEVDAGPCGGCDGGLCDGTRCVGCLSHADCDADEYCNPATDECTTGCRDDDGCTDPAAPICNAGTCEAGCSGPADCARFTAQPFCDGEGRCVECTADEPCVDGSQTCDLEVGACVDVTPDTLVDCLPCTNDRQCKDDRKCVPLEFEGAPRGHYCLRPLVMGVGCAEPYTVDLVARSTINGAATNTYCGIDEALTTCEAVRAMQEFERCPDTTCPDGGLCRQVGTLGGDRCTIPCAAADQCLPGSNAETCGGGDDTSDPPEPDYCGG